MKQRTQSLLQGIGRIPAAWWVVILTVPILVPLASAGGFKSHDGLLHVYRLAALDRAVRAGVFYPRWFPEFAFGYGHPVLNFYGPLSYYWGLPFTLLGTDAITAMKLVFASGLLASALAMYLFARVYLERVPAVVAAVVYAYVPYHLVDLYVRGAVAEFLAFVWFPLVLWAFQRLIAGPDRRKFYRLALSALLLAALVLTHSLSTLIFAPVLGAYLVMLLIKQRDRQATLRAIVALVLAVALSAFYWLPVLTESRWVGLGYGASQGYRDHLLSWSDLFTLALTYPYPVDDGSTPTYPLGWVQVGIIVAAFLLAFRVRARRWLVVLFLLLGLVSTFMLTTSSLPLWQTFERGLAFLQYPWRFQALVVLATAFLVGALFLGLTFLAGWSRALLAAALLLVIGLYALWRLPFAPVNLDVSTEAMWQMDRDHGQIGATWTGEYLPIWVTEQRWAISLPASVSVQSDDPLPAGEVKLNAVGHTRYDVTLDSHQGTTVALHQFHYPGWQAQGQIANSPLPSAPAGNLGLASFDIVSGGGAVSLRLAHTPVQRFGTLVSSIVSLVIGIALAARYRPASLESFPGPMLLAVCYLLVSAILVASLVLPNGFVRKVNQVNANLENAVELLAFTTDATRIRPGDSVPVTLYWRALRPMDQNYKTFVHLTDAATTHQPAQHDGDPGAGFSPTTRWIPGELVPDTHVLDLPADLASGRYRLWAGMYEYDTVRNLTVLSAGTPIVENRVLLGEIEVIAP